MGLNKFMLQKEEELLKKVGFSYKGLKLCELGDQIYQDKAAKLIYENLGVRHVSIDLNGRNGSIPLDLSKPLKLGKRYFDVITNYGTTEHVENQYEVFKNIHNLCRVGGVMINAVPLINNWSKHCRYYYDLNFFDILSELNDYEIIELNILDSNYYISPRNLVYAVLRKTIDNEFIKQIDFDKIEDLFDSGNKSKTQNYTKNEN